MRYRLGDKRAGRSFSDTLSEAVPTRTGMMRFNADRLLRRLGGDSD